MAIIKNSKAKEIKSILSKRTFQNAIEAERQRREEIWSMKAEYLTDDI
jgi:Asp-tRNA(Asn)/Glu-tRNA(Gln) amidotransferase B subunit